MAKSCLLSATLEGMIFKLGLYWRSLHICSNLGRRVLSLKVQPLRLATYFIFAKFQIRIQIQAKPAFFVWGQIMLVQRAGDQQLPDQDG